jgi:excisionase family DNA binding protein
MPMNMNKRPPASVSDLHDYDIPRPVALAPFRTDPLLDSVSASAILLIHPKTLQRIARSGQIPAVRIGKLWRFRRSDLEKWIEQRSSAA